ncbi:TetR/AcrR family transcriptional regulator [Streptomyces sp. NPDC005125]
MVRSMGKLPEMSAPCLLSAGQGRSPQPTTIRIFGQLSPGRVRPGPAPAPDPVVVGPVRADRTCPRDPGGRPGMTKRRPRTRAALLQAALEAFAAQGFHATSIEQICERAGYTRGAFYSNFSSKEELLFALFDAHSERVISRLTAPVDAVCAEGFPLDRLAELVSEVEPTQRDWYLVTTEFTLHAIRDPRAAWVLARHDARLRTEVARAFSECPRAAGRTLTVDPDDFARLLIAAPRTARTPVSRSAALRRHRAGHRTACPARVKTPNCPCDPHRFVSHGRRAVLFPPLTGRPGPAARRRCPLSPPRTGR